MGRGGRRWGGDLRRERVVWGGGEGVAGQVVIRRGVRCSEVEKSLGFRVCGKVGLQLSGQGESLDR